jgi:hypothetical protein
MFALQDNEIRSLQHDLNRLENALEAVLPIFPNFFDSKNGQWAYTVRRVPAENGASSVYSYSTNAMIACVLGHVLGYSGDQMLTVPAIKPLEAMSLSKTLRNDLSSSWKTALK